MLVRASKLEAWQIQEFKSIVVLNDDERSFELRSDP